MCFKDDLKFNPYVFNLFFERMYFIIPNISIKSFQNIHPTLPIFSSFIHFHWYYTTDDQSFAHNNTHPFLMFYICGWREGFTVFLYYFLIKKHNLTLIYRQKPDYSRTYQNTNKLHYRIHIIDYKSISKKCGLVLARESS